MTNYSRSVVKSNGLRRSKNLPVKFGFSSKTVPANIVQKLPAQRCSKPLFIAFFNFSHKRPTFAFTGESGYNTLGFAQRIAHKRLHVETGAFQMGALLLPSDRFARFGNPAWPGLKTANFAAFGSWLGVLPKNAESLRSSDALMCVAAPRRRGPAGLRNSVAYFDLFSRGHFRRWRRPPRTRTRPGPCGYRCGCRPSSDGDWRRYSPRPSGCPRCPGPTRRKTDPPWKV